MSPVLTPLRALAAVAENHLMQRGRFIGQFVDIFQLGADIVCVQHRVFRGLTQSIGAVGEDVGEGANEHAVVAIKHAHATDRLRTIVVEGEDVVRFFDENRRGQKRLQNFLAGHWT